MNYEIELKFKISNPKLIRNTLNNIGANYIKTIQQTDIYLDQKNLVLFKNDKALRIREEEGKLFLTFKDKRAKTREKIRKEITIEFSLVDKSKLLYLFKKIGFNKILSIKKEREIYRLDDFELCIDKVNKIGDFIEIEILKQNFNRTKLNNLMKKLGLAEDLIIEETYPELLIKRKLKKENK